MLQPTLIRPSWRLGSKWIDRASRLETADLSDDLMSRVCVPKGQHLLRTCFSVCPSYYEFVRILGHAKLMNAVLNDVFWKNANGRRCLILGATNVSHPAQRQKEDESSAHKLNSWLTMELTHAGPKDADREAELEPPSGTACDLLSGIVSLSALLNSVLVVIRKLLVARSPSGAGDLRQKVSVLSPIQNVNESQIALKCPKTLLRIHRRRVRIYQ